MNFDFSDEQKMLREHVSRALDAAAPLSEARRMLTGGDGYSQGAWKALAELGILGAAIPESLGGIGLGRLELCVAAQEIGRTLAPVPFLSTLTCAEAILAWGSDAQKQAWLPRLATGEAIGTWADAEGPVELRADNISTRLAAGAINGRKLPVLDGGVADVAVVLALGVDGPVLALADLSVAGVTRRAIKTIDPARPQGELTFDGAPAEPLAGAGEGWAAYRQLMNRASTLLAFEQVGAADRALMMARDYALERHAFGRPIGSYQGIKHKLANIYMGNEVARVHALWAAWATSTDAPELDLAAAGARVSANRALSYAAQENIQTHGGIGFTWESDCQLFYRRARLYAGLLGPDLDWKERIVSRIELRNAA